VIQDSEIGLEETHNGRLQIRWKTVNGNPSMSPFFVEKSQGIAFRLHRVPFQDLSEMPKVLNLLRKQIIINDMFLDYIQNTETLHANHDMDDCILRIRPSSLMILEMSIKGCVHEITVEIESAISLSIKIDPMDDSKVLRCMNERINKTWSLTHLIQEYVISCGKPTKRQQLDPSQLH
jgi:uridine kinase